MNEALGSQEQALVTFSGSLPAIRATYSDFNRLVMDLEALVKRAPSEETGKVCPLSYQVDGGKDSLAASSFTRLLNDPDLPNPATGFRIKLFIRLGTGFVGDHLVH